MVPKGWQKYSVGELCTSIVPGRNKPKVFDGDIPWVTTPEINGRYIPSKLQVNYVSTTALSDAGGKIVPQGAVVMAAVGELGLIAITSEPVVLNQQLHAFVCSKLVNNEYLAYWLTTQKPYMESIASKTTIPYMNKTNCESIPVLLPPLAEQFKIAQILLTWDKAISVTEKLLANSQQQKKALMQQLITGKKRLLDENGVRFSREWKQVELGDVFEKVSNGLTYDANSLDGLPVTRIETISTGRVNFEKVGWAPDCDNTRRFKLNLGDILYSHINSLEHIGRVAYFNDDKPLYHGMNLLLLRTKIQNNSLFLFHLLNSQVGKKYAKTYAKSAVNQASISTTDIKTFKVFIPERLEQQKIASVLSAADAEISILEKKLACLKDEKKALMQQLLTGKRRVKVDEAVAV